MNDEDAAEALKRLKEIREYVASLEGSVSILNDVAAKQCKIIAELQDTLVILKRNLSTPGVN